MHLLFNELKKYKISLLLILVFTYLSTTFELVIPILLANILNVGIIQNYGIDYIKNIIIMMITCIVISIFLNIIITYIINKISLYTAYNLKNDLFSKVLSLKDNEKNKYNDSSLINRTTQDIEQIKGFTTSLISIIFKAPILFFSCITILKELNKNFSILLITSISILIIYLIVIISKLFPLSKQMQLKSDKLNKILKEKIDNIKLIKSYNKLSSHDNDFSKANNDCLINSQKMIKLSSFIMPFLTLIINTITIIILLMSVKLVKTNQIEVGTIVATIQYILQILLSIVMISMILILIPNTKVSLSRINEIMNSKSYSFNDIPLSIDINCISFKDVNYKYNESTILDNFNLTINKGENIGIIGPTGSGKSTIAKLLLKEYELSEGDIYINDKDLNTLTRNDITNNITYIPKENNTLSGTILENIVFANNNITTEEISKIIYTCNLTDFVSSKEEKLNYKIEENGANLSSGQKQRIALARALASNKNVLILDDSFSSLDYKNEKEIISKLKMLYGDKTYITISQRISSLINCNKIFVIDKGKIIASGTHNELLEKCSFYKEMYALQKEVLEYDI